jgi:peroxiredoxin
MAVAVAALLAAPVGFVDGEEKAEEAKVYASAEDTQALKVGQKAPNVTLGTLDGETVELRKLMKRKPAVVVFYRGSWCPYCSEHLKALKEAEAPLKKMGFQIIAVSPDNPAHLKESIKDHELSYTLVSDSKIEAAKAFGVAFQVNDETVERYKGYGIDLVASSGEEHHVLPVPSVFIISSRGKIAFSHSDPNYKERLNNDKLLAAAKKARMAEGS